MINQLPDFSDVQSGSSSTANMPYRYSDSQALDFVSTYGDTKILGENDWWFNHTLSEYVADKGVGWPPHGIIVKPIGNNMLVWFDASGRLVVIDLTGYTYEAEFVASVKKPEYFEDPRYFELWQETIKPLIPTIPNITNMLMVVLGIGVVVLLIKKGR